MLVTPLPLAEALAAVDSDWQLIPVGPNKRPVDPATGHNLTDWGHTTYDVDEILSIADQSSHVRAVGVVLGPPSGIIAVDFDGKGSTGRFAEVFGRPWSDLPKTVTWSSGRTSRRQMAFRVPHDLWPDLRGRRYWEAEDGRVVLELRGAGHQSVIAGEHPDTDGYRWIRSPAEINTADAPEWLLEPLFKPPHEPINADYKAPTADDVPRALELLQHIKPRDAYDPWLRIGMALHSVDDGLLSAWVDWSRGCSTFDEAECLAKWQSFKGSGLTIGTLYHYAKQDGWSGRRQRNPADDPGPSTNGHRAAGADPPGSEAQQPPHRSVLTLSEIRLQLQQAVADGASRQELEAMRLTLAAAADIQPAALRDLLRTIEQEHDAAQSIAAEVASIKAAADRRDIGQALTLDWICPPSLAAALRIRCRSLPADDVAALATYLITVSGCIKLGTQVVASEAADYRVPLNLYGALVARSGAKKSPLSRLLVNAPTHDLRLELAQQNTRARRDWEEKNRGIKPAERDPEPQPVYLSISDFTCEALAEQLQIQESRGLGLLINRDELAGMFGNLNRYHSGRGGDEEQLLEAYDGSGFSSLRVAKIGGGRFYDRCHLSIYGTIQPAVLAELVKAGDASGLWARFMFVPLPERVVPIAETETLEEQQQATWAADTLGALCRYVYTLPKCSLVLSPAARRIFVGYEARCQADVHRTTIGAQGALLGKAAGKVLRVAALLHLLHQGCADGWHSDQVSDEVMHRACVLVDHINTWTLSLHQQVAEGANDLMRLIHRVALAAGAGSISFKDVVQRMSKGQRKENDSASVAVAMQALADLGVGEVEQGSRGAVRYRATGELP